MSMIYGFPTTSPQDSHTYPPSSSRNRRREPQDPPTHTSQDRPHAPQYRNRTSHGPHKIAPCTSPDGHKSSLKKPNMASGRSKSHLAPPTWLPKSVQESLKTPQERPKTSPDRPKRAHDSPKTTPRPLRIAPGHTQGLPRPPKIAPRPPLKTPITPRKLAPIPSQHGP